MAELAPARPDWYPSPSGLCRHEHPISGQSCQAPPHLTPWHSWGLLPSSVVLCGSLTYFDLMLAEAARLTERNLIVLLPIPVRPEFPRQQLDALHHRRIARCDAVHIMNVDGYLGRFATDALEHARALFKPITFYEPDVDLELEWTRRARPAADEPDPLPHLGSTLASTIRPVLEEYL